MRLLLAIGALALVAPLGAQAAPSQGLVQHGYHLYGQYCIACHGVGGTIGAGPLRAQGQQRAIAPSLRGVGAQAADFYLRTGYMPLRKAGAQPRRSRVLLGEDDIRALVAYVASLGKGPAIPKPHPERGDVGRGLHLFTDRCAGCHQVVAESGYAVGAIPPPLEDATPTQIAEAVRIGPNVMPRFSAKALSSRDVDSIIAYVQYAKNPDDRGGWALGHLGPIPEGIVTWWIGAAALVAVCVVIGKRLRRED
jgi:ubiquinol-cytochrome c reductase cytochrome c subunit